MNGGAKNPDDDSTGVRRAELYDHRAGSWEVLPAAEVVRNYHSVALLQPDGAVWTAGSNHDADAGGPSVREYRIEEFRPWYFCADRPDIDEAPDRACHGDRFEIRTGGDRPISEVVLVRCGSVTHSFNSDQRLLILPAVTNSTNSPPRGGEYFYELTAGSITLPFERSGDRIHTSIPDNGAIAVPGYYLLFVLDDEGVPSEGRYIQVCPDVGTDLGDLGDWRAELRRVLERTQIDPRTRRDLIADLDGYLRAELEARAPEVTRDLSGELTISELRVDAEGDDHESLTDEYITFTNVGQGPLSLGGWSVADEAGHVYVFPSGFELRPDQRVRLRTGAGTDTDSDLYWGASAPVWNNRSDTVYVYDNHNVEVIRNPYGQ